MDRETYKRLHRHARNAAKPKGYTVMPIPYIGDVSIWPLGGGLPVSVARASPNPRGAAATFLDLCHEARDEPLRVIRRDLHRRYIRNVAAKISAATPLP